MESIVVYTNMPTDNLTDEQLIVHVRGEDKEMYAEIVKRYQGKLYRYLRKFLHSHDELEDVLQEVFIKAYKNLYDFDVQKKFSSWLYRIAHNEALNHIKKYSKEVMSLDSVEWEVVDEKMDLIDKLDIKISREDIETAFVSLKKKYLEPIVLYFFEERTYEEISDILRIPRNTVGIRIMRGKIILKEYLKEKYGRR